MILNVAKKLLPIRGKNNTFYEFWIVISVQAYSDNLLEQKDGEPVETVNSIAGYPDEIVQLWMNKYKDKLSEYKRKARAKYATVVRVSETKKAKFSQAGYRKAS